MLRLLHACRRAPYQVLGAGPRPWPLASGPGSECRPSSRCSKRKAAASAAPPRPPPALARLPDSPKPALCGALGGLLPLAAPPLAMLLSQAYVPVLAWAQVTYGASLLAFLGGVRWGFTLPPGSPAQPDARNLACSGAPLLFSWYALLLCQGPTEAAVMVLMGFGVALHNEVFLLPHYPDWFKALRVLVTLVAVLSLVATLIIKDFYPEAGPKPPAWAR